MSEQQAAPVFNLEKIYLKDVSFESPNTPNVFMQKDFNPEIKVDLDVSHSTMSADGFYEVVLSVEVRAAVGETGVFLVSVEQAGIFRAQNFSDAQLAVMLSVACPDSLMPFVRETVADLVTKGGFPQLLLAPVNFDALHRKKLKEQQAAVKEAEGAQTH